jgi:hypothetical protein
MASHVLTPALLATVIYPLQQIVEIYALALVGQTDWYIDGHQLSLSQLVNGQDFSFAISIRLDGLQF